MTALSHIKEAEQANSDLHIFHGIIALLEGGTVSPASRKTTQKIIALCVSERAACLRRLDKARAAACSKQ